MSRRILVAFFAASCALAPLLVGASEVRRVAVVPLETYGDRDLSPLRAGLVDLVASRIAADSRIELAKAGAVEAAVGRLARGRLDDAAADAVGKDLGVDAVVWGSLTSLGKSSSVSLKLTEVAGRTRYFSFTTDNPDEVLPRVSALAGEIQKALLEAAPRSPPAALPTPPPPAAPSLPAPPPPQAVTPLPAPAQPPPAAAVTAPGPAGLFPFEGSAPWTSDDLPYAARGMAVGDVDGDGRNEIVTIGGASVHLYRLEKGDLTRLAEYQGKAYEEFVSVGLGDAAQGGRRPILVTSVRDGPRSLVLESQGGALRLAAEGIRFFVRRVEGKGPGAGLLGQEMATSGWPFQGEIFQLIRQGESYARGEKAALPKGFALYHFALGDLNGDGKAEYVAVDGKGGLLAYGPDLQFLGQASGAYAASCVGWQRARGRGNDADSSSTETLTIPVGMVSRDLDGDGSDELLVAKNAASGLLSLVTDLAPATSAEVVGLKWGGGRFSTVGKLEGVDGCIVGLASADVDGNGSDELVIGSVRRQGPSWSGAKSGLQIYFRK